jgi:insulysin
LKTYALLLCLALASFLNANESLKYEAIVDKCGLSIETPAFAKREIKKLRLENGLEAFIISDPETHQSGAALAVGVGSWDDPVERPGMAHFVEHLLFLGTEKYPDEEGYIRYLDEHGGERNAFTMADRTVYIFSVNNEGFLGAFDRFGQFFISPRFNPSGVDRECKAIHQEYCKDLPLDPWRMLYVKKELANKNHPFHSFCIGNSDTLAKISQDELKEWYLSHYSANLMHLVVYSSLDMPTLEKEVVELFGQVKNKNKQPSKSDESLLLPERESKLCAITPVQDVQLLELCWEIPRFYGQDLAIHADKLLSHVLGHEGSTSLLAQLKRENLADALSVGKFRAGNDQCLISLSIELTTKGVHEYDTVIERCFEALATLKISGIPRYIFDEVCQIEELRYKFQSRQEVFDLVSEYATSMVDEPLETFPRHTLIPSCYAPDKIKELMSHLTPQTCLYTLVAHPHLTKIEATIKERWMGVGYSLVKIPEEKMRKWEEASLHMAMSIPRPNPFLPTNLCVKGKPAEKEGILPHPSLISNDALGKVYVVQDQHFLVPEVCWIFAFKTPQISDADPLTNALADIYCHTISEQLKTSSYEALMGGLSFNLKPKHGALELKIVGYSEKAPELLKKVIETMKTACPTEAQFPIYVETLQRDYSNDLTVSPLKQGGELMWSILFKEFSGLEQKAQALKRATYKQMCSFSANVLKESYVEGMLFGNMTVEESSHAWELIKQTLAFSCYAPERHPKIQLAHLPAQDPPAYLLLQSEHPSNALILVMDCGNFSLKRRAAQEILTKGLEEPFFSELRTRQQTAYVVANWSQELERHLYNFFAIQSTSHDTRDLLARFELFIESSLQHLSEKVIPEERFESIRAAYLHQLEKPAENLSKMGSFLHTITFQYEEDFDWMEKRIKAFQELTYDEFLHFAQEFLGKENCRRLAICVNGDLPKKGKIAYREVTTPEKLRSEICYESKDNTSLTIE